jgi:hypothetical protein
MNDEHQNDFDKITLCSLKGAQNAGRTPFVFFRWTSWRIAEDCFNIYKSVWRGAQRGNGAEDVEFVNLNASIFARLGASIYQARG